MSEEKNLEEIKKFWPKNAPDINSVPKYIDKYKKELIVIKYGGNVLIDRNIFNNFIEDISTLNKLGLSIIVVHGGGPRIERKLKLNRFDKGMPVAGDLRRNSADRLRRAQLTLPCCVTTGTHRTSRFSKNRLLNI